MSNESSGVTLSSKASFALGLAGGVLVLCTIGFFILLGLVLSGNLEGEDRAVAAANPAQAAAPTAPAPAAEPEKEGLGEIPPITDADHVEGPADADITMYVYTDVQCPYCSRFHPSMTQAMDEFEGQIRTVVRHFPLSFHPNARPAANAAECAGEQGEFYAFFDGLFENQARLGDALYDELAVGLGLSMSQFNDCLESEKYDDKVSADLAGGISAGVKGTPGTIIVGQDSEPQLVPGAVPYESLKSMIESAL